MEFSAVPQDRGCGDWKILPEVKLLDHSSQFKCFILTFRRGWQAQKGQRCQPFIPPPSEYTGEIDIVISFRIILLCFSIMLLRHDLCYNKKSISRVFRLCKGIITFDLPLTSRSLLKFQDV